MGDPFSPLRLSASPIFYASTYGDGLKNTKNHYGRCGRGNLNKKRHYKTTRYKIVLIDALLDVAIDLFVVAQSVKL
jgi:hypothetical protein